MIVPFNIPPLGWSVYFPKTFYTLPTPPLASPLHKWRRDLLLTPSPFMERGPGGEVGCSFSKTVNTTVQFS